MGYNFAAEGGLVAWAWPTRDPAVPGCNGHGLLRMGDETGRMTDLGAVDEVYRLEVFGGRIAYETVNP